MEHDGVFCAESPFPAFNRLLVYRDFLNNKSNLNNAFGVHLSMPFPPPKVESENTKNDFFMEHGGIFYAEAPFPEFNRPSGYGDLLNNKSDRSNAFGVHFFLSFPTQKVHIENTESEIFMEHEGTFSAESPFAEFSPLLAYRDLLNNKSK